MNNVTDIREAGEDASVLTDTGSGVLLGRAVLSEGALADHIEADETPRYVLRNRKHGVTVEGPDGTDEHEPDRRHSGVAVLSDVRVLFAVGRSGDDLTLSVSLDDVVDARTEDGLLGGAFVVETVTDERYRFHCRGDLEPVREYLDAAAGVWTRAQRHVDEARDQVERLRSAFESGNADVVLAATGDVEAKLADAREAADALDGARAQIERRATDVRTELAALERRAYAEYAEQVRERAHVRWDDGDYEAAMDNVGEADDAYAAALDIDTDEPDDDLLTGRRETLAEERERLSDAPLDRAEHAVDVATAAGDPGPAVDWWETAVERYETALSLDWGRDDRRFAGDHEALRDDLADAARALVAAHCDHAREHVADGDEVRESDPEAAADAYDRAAGALAAAREVTRERVPDAADDVEDVAATLEDRLEALPGDDDPVGATVDGGRTAATARQTADESDDGESATAVDDVESDTSDPGDAESDEATDRREAGETGDVETVADSGESDPLEETETVLGEQDGESVDAGPGKWLTGEELVEDRASSSDATGATVTDPATVDAEALPSLVARVFESAGWSTTVFGAGAGNRYDLLAGTDGPVSVTVCVWTVHPDTHETLDAATVERYANYFEGVEEADAAAICSAAPVSETARARAADTGFELLDESDLVTHLDSLALDPDEF